MHSWTRMILGMCMAAMLGGGVTANCAQTKPSPEAAAIRNVLEAQVAAWNRGDIPAFMAGYWKSDDTEFVNGAGIFQGWQDVLNRYRRSYPNRAAMGHLTFSGLEIHVLCAKTAYVVGRFRLDREADQPQGVFTLIFRKFPDGWKIINDHTTEFAARNPVKKPS